MTNLCFRLYNAYRTCNDLTILAIQYLLKERTTFTPTSSRLAFNTVEKYEVLGGPSVLVLVNTLARDAFSLQIVAVNNSQELQVRVGINIHRTAADSAADSATPSCCYPAHLTGSEEAVLLLHSTYFFCTGDRFRGSSITSPLNVFLLHI